MVCVVVEDDVVGQFVVLRCIRRPHQSRISVSNDNHQPIFFLGKYPHLTQSAEQAISIISMAFLSGWIIINMCTDPSTHFDKQTCCLLWQQNVSHIRRQTFWFWPFCLCTHLKHPSRDTQVRVIVVPSAGSWRTGSHEYETRKMLFLLCSDGGCYCCCHATHDTQINIPETYYYAMRLVSCFVHRVWLQQQHNNNIEWINKHVMIE